VPNEPFADDGSACLEVVIGVEEKCLLEVTNTTPACVVFADGSGVDRESARLVVGRATRRCPSGLVRLNAKLIIGQTDLGERGGC
jgi:hypothetical protein